MDDRAVNRPVDRMAEDRAAGPVAAEAEAERAALQSTTAAT